MSFKLWIGMLFADRWFDYSYLLRIISRKCKHDAKKYETKGIGAEANIVAKDLYEVANICDRLTDEENYYLAAGRIAFEKRWDPAHTISYYTRCQTSIDQERNERLELNKKVAELMNKDAERLGELFKKVLEWSD